MRTCSNCGKEGEFYSHNYSGKVKEDLKCKICTKETLKEYRRKNREKVLKITREWQDKKRFGAPRGEILKDRCEMCGSTRRLSIHHRDGNGRNKSAPNNSTENLQTVCNRCHALVHARLTAKRYDKDLQRKVLELWDGRSLREIGRTLGLYHQTVKSIYKASKESGKM